MRVRLPDSYHNRTLDVHFPVASAGMRRDARENRERITRAARAVFAARGLGATLHDIADHAGVGVGTVYRHFPGKEHVVATVFDEEVDRVVGLAERALQHPQPWEGFTQFFLDVAGELTADRGLQEVMLAAEAGAPAESSAQARLAPLVKAVVARAQESGELRADFDAVRLPDDRPHVVCGEQRRPRQ